VHPVKKGFTQKAGYPINNMAKSGPIIIVEDDHDDQEIIQEIIRETGVKNEIIFFDRSEAAFRYLKTTPKQPFIILSDVNLPRQNGVEFKRQIDEDPLLRAKSIPFIFFSTSVEKSAVDTAYRELTVQGFFKKENSYAALKDVIHVILQYWKICRHPNSAE